MQHDPETSENETFECITCKYVTNRQSDYARHMLTVRHLKRTKCNTSAETRTDPRGKYGCECGKSYSHRSSLWVHMKRCQPAQTEHLNAQNARVSAEVESSEKVNRVLPISHTFTTEPENIVHNTSETDHIMQCVQTMITAQAEAHAAHAEAAAEQTRMFIEAISLKGPQCITNNNTTNNNTQFNLNVFLNEDCKDAYTLREVVDSIECTVMDLDRMDKDGYAATVVRKIMESMQDMSITERPIHCTDARRNTVCVKSEEGWERDEAAMKRLNNSVFRVGRKLSSIVDDWREVYPDHFRGTDSRRKQYHRLITNTLKMTDGNEEARIASKICKGVVLDRKEAMGKA
jgi:hypothetical protein